MRAKTLLIVSGVIILILLIIAGTSELKNIGDSYSEDLGDMMNPDHMTGLNINPDATAIETFVKVTPKGSEAVVEGVEGVDSFLNGVVTVVLIIILLIGVIAFFHFRAKAREEDEYRRRFSSRNDSYRNRRF